MTDHPFHYDMPSVRISDSEIVVQKACLRSIAIMLPNTRVAAVPNAGKRTRWAAGRAKAEGMSKGFPDLMMIGKYRSHIHSELDAVGPLVAFIEIKAKAPMTIEQKEWMVFLMDCGHHCGVFRSDQTLIAALQCWGFT